MKTSNLSFTSAAEKLVLNIYELPDSYSPIFSEILSRVAAFVLLSPAAALDFTVHSALILPSCLYAIGKSVYQKQIDFTLPWQHLQRVYNAVCPIFFGSLFGFVHPYMGLTVCEATDKHAAIGMLSSNTVHKTFNTPCSPIHSLSIVKRIAENHRYSHLNGAEVEIFSDESIQILKGTKELESFLESLQAQEFIHKITNITLFVMANIVSSIHQSHFSEWHQEVLLRAAGFLVPILTAVDMTVAMLAQAFFLATGAIRLLTGRGPIYTEVTTNPLMHVSFLIQNTLKALGNLIGTCAWFISPAIGFKVSLLPAIGFFRLQMSLLMLHIKIKMFFAEDNSRFVVPIIFGNGECSALSVPTHSMHKTYLIVEKQQNDQFNLYWVNRPTISCRKGLDTPSTLDQIHSMLNERFPFMNLEKVLKYPVIGNEPEFPNATSFASINSQGNKTNCVVSNLFGMLEALDKISGKHPDITETRYKAVRQALTKDYGFYKYDFFPFADESDGYSLAPIWNATQKYPLASI